MTEPDQKAEGTNEVAGLRKEYKQSITSNQKRKYFFIIVVIALSAFSSWPELSKIQDLVGTFWVAVLCGAVIALVLTFLQDYLLKEGEEVKYKLDRLEFADKFAENFFTSYTENGLVDQVLQRIITHNLRRPVVLKALASSVITDTSCINHDLVSRVERTYLYPADNQPRFADYESKSTLTDFNPQTGTYKWWCKRTMKTIRTVTEYRIVLCGKSDIEFIISQSAKLEHSKGADARVADAVFTLSSFSSDIAQKWFEDLRGQFVVHASDGNRRKIEPQMDRDQSKMKDFPGRDKLSAEDYAFCRYYWEESGPGNEIEMSFEAELSLVKDPFIYDTLHEFAFVKSLDIDYSAIKNHCGSVSEIICVRGPGWERENRNGRFSVQARAALAGPGDGVVLVFRPTAAVQPPLASSNNQASI